MAVLCIAVAVELELPGGRAQHAREGPEEEVVEDRFTLLRPGHQGLEPLTQIVARIELPQGSLARFDGGKAITRPAQGGIQARLADGGATGVQGVEEPVHLDCAEGIGIEDARGAIEIDGHGAHRRTRVAGLRQRFEKPAHDIGHGYG
ncbi:MAG: hypothetical protein ACREXX_12835, partial [Gammaproteobacteria bacterium]